ncbi:MAG: 16S rRNA processing protein RimM [Oscillospiraceae bacterium]|nr:16S rRNA processing protein RimM [Oscillospiraceae bacterium]
MVKEYLDCGTVVNTHGVKGEIKINPEADSPAFLLQFHTLYLSGNPYEVTSARVHKGCVIAKLSGVDTIEAAQALRGMTVSFARKDAKLEPGAFFLQDLIGLTALDAATGEKLGLIDSVLYLPAGGVYVIKGEAEILVPARSEFLGEQDFEAGTVAVKLIEGMV